MDLKSFMFTTLKQNDEGVQDAQALPEVTPGLTARVADVEHSIAAEASMSNLSRVKFSVHVRLPQGGKNADPHHGRMSGLQSESFEERTSSY